MAKFDGAVRCICGKAPFLTLEEAHAEIQRMRAKLGDRDGSLTTYRCRKLRSRVYHIGNFRPERKPNPGRAQGQQHLAEARRRTLEYFKKPPPGKEE